MKKVYFWELWNWKPVRNIGIFLSVIFVAYLLLSRFKEYQDKKQSDVLSGITTAKFESIEPVQGMHQTKALGTISTVEYYKVTFSFMLNKKFYLNSAVLYNVPQNRELINQLIRRQKKEIQVRYNPLQPEQSSVISY